MIRGSLPGAPRRRGHRHQREAAWDNNLAGSDGATSNGPPPKLRNVDCGWRLDGPAKRLDHEDLTRALDPGPDFNDPAMAFHGTAALGIVLGEDNRTGVVGIVPKLPNVGLAYYDPYNPVHDPQNPNLYSLANAIGTAVAGLTLGDVLLIEAQAYLPGKLLAPVEVHDFEWRAIQTATAAGIIVVEPCGNGTNGGVPALDVDSLHLSDSGAILVSAALSWLHYPLDYSPYGARVDCYAWGDSVCTCWDDGTGSKQVYDAATGTTAAAAIIAGAALAVQCAHIEKNAYGARLDALQMRAKLKDPNTSTPSLPDGTGRLFGVMPDVYAIITAL